MRTTLLCGLAVALLAAPALAQNVRGTQLVSTNNNGTVFRPNVASFGENTVGIWTEDFTNDVWISKSNGRGLAFDTPVQASIDAAGTGISKFLSDEGYSVGIGGAGNVYVNWTDVRFDDVVSTGLEISLFFNVSNAAGTAFGPEQVVPFPGTTMTSETASIRDFIMLVTEDGGTDYIYVLATIDPDATTNLLEEVWLATWNSATTTWSTQFVPSGYAQQGEDQDLIGMCVDGQTVVVCWTDTRLDTDVIDPVDQQNDLWFRYSTDAGATWAITDTQVDTSGAELGDVNQAIDCAVQGDMILFGWAEERAGGAGGAAPDDIYARTYSISGGTFGPEKIPFNYNYGVDDADGADVSIIDGNPMIITRDNRTTAEEVYIARSFDGGLLYSDTLVSDPGGVASTGRFAEFPRAVGNGGGTTGDVYCAVWTDNAGLSTDACYTRDGGANWTTVELDSALGNHGFARAAFNELYNNSFAYWSDDRLGTFNSYVSGFRPQTLEALGTYQFGSQIFFEVTEYPESEVGANFKVTASKNLATPSNNAMLSDGRFLDVRVDNFFNKSINIGALSGSVGAGGVGQTGMLNFPNPTKVPPGTNLRLVAWTFLGPFNGSITDIVEQITS